ncbi:hypothetical protein Tsubulata_015536 [Turnera subulata]|uniref:Exopolygalacturonase-like n=1 Tax=Turnera subulata TaxID=218843 RepID=A0A9Q0G0X3_9ROSI|nr:hypothetical protein Tsubulata_015536 [Turnera subulata]
MHEARAVKNVYNVIKYGAIADGKTDISQAILKAWDQACHSKGTNVLLIPRRTFMSRQVALKGPCNGPIHFTVRGVLLAPTDLSSLHLNPWISFQYIDRLTINGGGKLNGQGPSAWPYNDCSRNPKCFQLPVSVRMDFLTHSQIRNITLIDSKSAHLTIFGCKNLKIKNIQISAPGDSPNTDGIDIGGSQNIQILDSQIGTGDDCISLGPGSKQINVSNINCGPGHGLSIGSLGKSLNEEEVTGVTIRNCIFNGTTNGVRIKSWAPSYPGSVSDVTYDSIQVINVQNPINIDQNYCPSGNCPEAASSVKISNVKFKEIWGSSASKIAVSLQCSKSIPCQEIELNDINLVYYGGGHGGSSCSNAYGAAYGKQIPFSCLSRRAT